MWHHHRHRQTLRELWIGTGKSCAIWVCEKVKKAKTRKRKNFASCRQINVLLIIWRHLLRFVRTSPILHCQGEKSFQRKVKRSTNQVKKICKSLWKLSESIGCEEKLIENYGKVKKIIRSNKRKIIEFHHGMEEESTAEAIGKEILFAGRFCVAQNSNYPSCYWQQIN